MTTSRHTAIRLTAVAVAALIASCGGSAPAPETTASPSPPQSFGSPVAAPFNHADLMFARHMIPHHQQAIQLSDIILGKQDINSRVTDMASQIKAAQGPEIEQMQAWLHQWGKSAMNGMSGPGMPGMDGMLSATEIQNLQIAKGDEASQLFLSQMIRHHQGAIVMARAEVANGQYPDTIALAESIITSQQKEIDTMNEILKSL